MRIERVARLLVLLLTIAPAPSAESATVLEVERVVVGASFVEAARIDDDTDQIGFASSSAGSFVEAAVGGAGIGDLTNAFTESLQDTDLVIVGDGFRLEGGGSAGVEFDVDDAGEPSRAQASADSTLKLIFEVTQASGFALAVSLSAERSRLEILSGLGPVEGDHHAFARLTGVVSGVLLDFSVADLLADGNAVVESRVQSGVLAPDTYLLEVGASSFQRGFEDAVGLGWAGFGLDFTLVPEPDTALLVALGLAALGAARRGRRSPGES